ncbi:MAG: hypothetical protein HQ558_01020 [Candidatus Omnitrophica bacterium]|nr:hypothetical protein [Candidatus Omnitrophota bacterium]
MTKARMVDQLLVSTPNEVGTLGNLTEALLSAGVNILHLCAYAEGDKGSFMIISSDNDKCAEIMKNMGYEVSKSKTMEIEFENKPGTLAPIAKNLAENGIDIQYIFGTSADGNNILGIISTSDNDAALQMINE